MKGKKLKIISVLLIVVFVFHELSVTSYAAQAQLDQIPSEENVVDECDGLTDLSTNSDEENSADTARMKTSEDDSVIPEAEAEEKEEEEENTLFTEEVSADQNEFPVYQNETDSENSSDTIIAQGTTNNVTWMLYESGLLTIDGEGDYERDCIYDRPVWCGTKYRESIKSVKVIRLEKPTTLRGMFGNLTSLESVDFSGLDFSQVTDMYCMFYRCTSLKTIDLSKFNTSKVTNMKSMFSECSGLTALDLSKFDTSQVVDMAYMFGGCSELTTLDLSKFNTNKVNNMLNMFSRCSNLENITMSDLFDTSQVTNMQNMFGECSSLKTIDLSSFKTGNVLLINYMFADCSSLTSLDVSGFDMSMASDMCNMFSGCSSLTSLDISRFKTDNVVNMSEMFSGCSELINLNISGLNTGVTETMAYMFRGCSKLTSLDVSSFQTGNVTTMSYMFSGCSGLSNLDLSKFETSKVTDMSCMFSGCSELTSLDVSSFQTGNVTTMSYMFSDCSKLTGLDVSSFQTGNVTNMSGMFSGCSKLTNLDLNCFQTGKVTNMSDMFSNCSNLTSLNLSSFDMSNALYTSSLLNGCSNLTTLYSPKNVKSQIPLPVSVEADKWYQSDGKEVTELVKDAAYSISLEKNSVPQNYTYIDEVAVAALSDASTLFVYNAEEQKPAVTVTYKEDSTAKLEEGKDYSIQYLSNINAGEAHVRVTGIGLFRGSIDVPFTISKAESPKMEDAVIEQFYPAEGEQNINLSDIVKECCGISETPSNISINKHKKEEHGLAFTHETTIRNRVLYYTIDSGEIGAYADIYAEVSFNNYEDADWKITVNLIEKYMVRFDNRGIGENPSPITGVRKGLKIDKPIISAEGYQLEGWYMDPECTKKWDFAKDIVTENMTLYANWYAQISDLQDSFKVREIENAVYTGQTIKPAIYVYDKNTLLKENTDYTVIYKNNVNVNSTKKTGNGIGTELDNDNDNFCKELPYVIIKGKGNYTGTLYVNFNICPANIADEEGNEAARIVLKYSAQNSISTKEIHPFISLKYKTKMTPNKDFECKLATSEDSYNKDASKMEANKALDQDKNGLPVIPAGCYGTFELQIEGKGNYCGTIRKKVYVAKKENLIGNAAVSLGSNLKKLSYSENFSGFTPAIYDEKSKAYYKVFNGIVTEERLDAKDVFTVKCGKTYLICGKDFSVTYSNPDAAGNASMMVEGIGDYKGTKMVPFKMVLKKFSASTVRVENLCEVVSYTGINQTQNNVALIYNEGKSDETQLIQGIHYDISYKANLNKGKAKMIFTALPNAGYSGSFSKTFTITAYDIKLNESTFAELLKDLSVPYQASGAVPDQNRISQSIESVLGRTCVLGKDYTVSYKNNKKVAASSEQNPPTLIIKGKGNYTGSISVPFTITQQTLADTAIKVELASIQYKKQAAEKKAYKPTVKVTDGKGKLKAGKDYTVTYYKNTQKELAEYLDVYQKYQSGEVDEAALLEVKPYAVIQAAETSAYTGERRVDVSIWTVKLSNSNVYMVVENLDQQVYKGSQVTPTVKVYYSSDKEKLSKAKQVKETNPEVLQETYGLTLLKDTASDGAKGDYYLTYGANIHVGKSTGTVTIDGVSPLYAGSVKKSFQIGAKIIE